MRRFLVVIGLLLLSGCADPVDPDDDPVRLVVEEAVVTDRAVTLRLVNESSHAVAYSFCDSFLEKDTAAAWVRAEPARPCLAIAYVLGPHAEARHTRMLPRDLATGHYRITAEIQWLRQLRFPLNSNTFEVR